MIRFKLVRTLMTASPLLLALLLGTQMSGFGQESDSAKIARLLNETGTKMTKTADSTWTIEYEGKSMKDITVGVTFGDGILVTYARITESKGVKFSTQVLEKLLQLNFTFDRVKVGIDKEAIIFVRTDMTVRTLDKEELSAGIEQVAAAADETHKVLRSHLPKAK